MVDDKTRRDRRIGRVYRSIELGINDLGLEKSAYDSLLRDTESTIDYARRLYTLEETRSHDIACYIEGGIGPYHIRINTTPESKPAYEVAIRIPVQGLPVDVRVGITERDIEVMGETGQRLKDYIRDVLSRYIPRLRTEMRQEYEAKAEEIGVEPTAQETKDSKEAEKTALALIATVGGLTLINVLTTPQQTARVVLPNPSMIVTFLGLGLILFISLSLFLLKRKKN